MMTIDRLLERLKNELVLYDNRVEEYDLKYVDAMKLNDQNSAAYWQSRSDQAWRRTKDLRTAILIIKESVGG